MGAKENPETGEGSGGDSEGKNGKQEKGADGTGKQGSGEGTGRTDDETGDRSNGDVGGGIDRGDSGNGGNGDTGTGDMGNGSNGNTGDGDMGNQDDEPKIPGCPAGGEDPWLQQTNYECTGPSTFTCKNGLKCPTFCCPCADGKSFRSSGCAGSRCLSETEACLCGKPKVNKILPVVGDPANLHCE